MITWKQKVEEGFESCDRRLGNIVDGTDIPVNLMMYHYVEGKVAQAVKLGIYSAHELASYDDMLDSPGYFMRNHHMSIYAVY